MSFFRGQFANVVEWEEFRDDMIFWKWNNKEIKKGSKLIIRPGQDAIFMNNGRIEGIFTESGDYNIESDIIPFLSTLKGFKFGFNSGMRVEVLFVNTKVFQVKWGTKNAINIPSSQLPGGIPVRANGTFSFKVDDYITLIDQIAGIKESYVVDEVKQRISANLDQLLMKWITKEGKDLFNLQANAFEISEGIKEDLDMIILKNGLTIEEFNVMSFNYPKEIQEMITKTASHGMVGDMNRYQKIAMTEAMAKSLSEGGNKSSSAADMAGITIGMNMANEMMKQMKQSDKEGQSTQEKQQSEPPKQENTVPNFCPNCGEKTTGTKFCPNCGYKLV
ncbi:SPFH domain-containing protein [Metabacillus malikii]|uniref:Membrane protease subunit (Stomatin/prohibitin family) n=1 Tax=Metabacillus malikii TaxID=1504265 RepID=A0ABT9ZBX0_9BACI|nr:SPFH domain-containing protein [Metabacillus malikii]MDQ0229754.1 membrane protease subunit (stomatin/prohibitin family) [Metabacillus malikii]